MKGRFPIALTAWAGAMLAVLVGLGFWQLHRLAWKKDLLARIERLKDAPPRPLGAVLAEAARGADVGFVRVQATCEPAPAAVHPIYRYALRGDRVGWRLMGACRLADGASIALDRGLVARFAGQMAPAAAVFAPPAAVTGVLRKPGKPSFLTSPPATAADGSVTLQAVDPAALALIAGAGGPAYYLAVESENPPLAGVAPAALPEAIPNNHFIYALTWFGLAGVLIWMWAAFVIRRMRGE